MRNTKVETSFVFPALYEAECVVELSAGLKTRVVFSSSPPERRGAALLVQVRGDEVEPWVGELRGPGTTVGSAATGLHSAPHPYLLCLLVEGEAFLVDVRHPESYTSVSTSGPVVGVKPVPSAGLLLLATPWKVSAIGERGVVWQTRRLAIEGVRLDEVQGWRLAGVADPEDDESRDLVIDLRTGTHEGGFPSND